MMIVDLTMSIELDREARLAVLGGIMEGGCVVHPQPPICGTPVPGSMPGFELPFIPVPSVPMKPSIESVPSL